MYLLNLRLCLAAAMGFLAARDRRLPTIFGIQNTVYVGTDLVSTSSRRTRIFRTPGCRKRVRWAALGFRQQRRPFHAL
jgi:hypothetical protein